MTADIDAEKFRRIKQLTETIRETMALSMTLAAENTEIDALHRELHSFNERLRRHSGKRPFPAWRQHAKTLNEQLPYSPVSGPLNPVAPPLPMRAEGGGVAATVTFSALFEGPPQCVHGAVIAGAYDQLLAMANARNDTHGPTGRLTVRYRRPTPLHRALDFTAQVERIEGRKVHVVGTCHDGEELLTECEGLFIQYDPANSSWQSKDRQFD